MYNFKMFSEYHFILNEQNSQNYALQDDFDFCRDSNDILRNLRFINSDW